MRGTQINSACANAENHLPDVPENQLMVGALLFGFLERSAQILDLNNIPKEIFQIMEAIIILSVVIAYEVVQRWLRAQEVKAAAEQTRHVTAQPEAPVSA